MVSVEARQYRAAVARQLAGVPGFGAASVRLLAKVCPPDGRRRDLSNAIKVLEDALVGGGVMDDDQQVDELHWYRGPIDRPHGYVDVTVEAIDAMDAGKRQNAETPHERAQGAMVSR